jgi:thioredoxin reductase (NADPH)
VRLSPASLPAVVLRDGRALADPTNEEIADALGDFAPTELRCDLAVVGAGPAGLGAAVYGGSEGLSTIVVEPHVIGGQAGASSLIRNFFGFPRGISGLELTQRAFQQAWVFGAKFVLARGVQALLARGDVRVLRLSDGREITARAVIVATGAQYRRLDARDLDRFLLRGVYHTTPSDARLVTGQDVFVVGGGNSAGQAAVHLAKYARRVTLLVRRGSIEETMSDYLVQHVRSTPKLEVRVDTEVVGGDGDRRLQRIRLRDLARGIEEEVPAGMLFVLIGALPRTDWLAGTLARDTGGYLVTGADLPPGAWREARRPHPLETSMPGVFAAGDVRSGSVKRVAAAVGEGAAAVQGVHAYLAGAKDEPPVRSDVGADGVELRVLADASQVARGL